MNLKKDLTREHAREAEKKKWSLKFSIKMDDAQCHTKAKVDKEVLVLRN